MMQLSAHFTLAELVRSPTASARNIANLPDRPGIEKLKLLCLNVLEPVRAHFGRPVRINSGYRSLVVNAVIGGSANSQHCKCEAVDFEIPGVANGDIARFIERRGLPHGFDQLILENYTPGEPSSGWVHCSWVAAGNRGQVLTMIRRDGRATYVPGLRA